jgi:hypothetical protein
MLKVYLQQQSKLLSRNSEIPKYLYCAYIQQKPPLTPQKERSLGERLFQK